MFQERLGSVAVKEAFYQFQYLHWMLLGMLYGVSRSTWSSVDNQDHFVLSKSKKTIFNSMACTEIWTEDLDRRS